MLRLSSIGGMLRSLDDARTIELYAYTLRPGPLVDRLEDAAQRGARVRVRLTGTPYGDGGPALLRRNRRLVDALARCGADAGLTPSDDPVSLHVKAAVVDGRLFLDDRNFGPQDFIVRDDTAGDLPAFRSSLAGRAADSPGSVAFDKPSAVALEAALIRHARRPGDVVVETETFGSGAVNSALVDLAARGGSPRLLVSSRQARPHTRERAELEKLARAGVRVRLCRDSEKFALAGNAAWVGSANASPAFGAPAADWGATTRAPAIVAEARRRVEAAWAGAKPLRLR